MISKIAKIKNKKNKSKIVCLTAYSKNIAQAIDKYTDIILVGDSLGSTLYNFKSTRSVTLEMMIRHSQSVRQGIVNSLMVVDMPYNTYNNPSQALKNCKFTFNFIFFKHISEFFKRIFHKNLFILIQLC